MKKIVLVLFCLGSIAAQASYLPFLGGIRSAIVDRQTTISNEPPITTAGKKELNVLKAALKSIDKPSASLASDLKALSSVVLKVNKGASNETLAFEFRLAVNSYYGALIATNDTLEAALADANNSPKLKAKAQATLESAQMALALIDPQADVNGAAKALPKVLSSFLKATKAVAAAVNARPTPLPNPKSGTVVVEVASLHLIFGAEFPLRNTDGTGLVGEGEAAGSTSQLIIHIPSSAGPGAYTIGWIFSDTVSGTSITFGSITGDAEVTAASASALVGTISGTALVRINGGDQQTLPYTARFSGKKFSFIP